METVNNKVLCEAPESTSIKVDVKNGFGRVKQKVSVLALKVVAETFILSSGKAICRLSPGEHLYVSGESINHQWMRDTYTINGNKCVLVPWDSVLLRTMANEPVLEIGSSKGETQDQGSQVMVKQVE